MGREVFEMPKKARDLTAAIAHFWSKVDKTSVNGCWPWLEALTSMGYGKFYFAGKTWIASRFAWLATHGAIEKIVLHNCHNRKCCRPDHLRLGTNKDNTWDMILAGRSGNKRCQRYIDDALAEKMFQESLQPGIHMSDIARKYGVSNSAANWNVNRIRDSRGISRKPGKLSIDNRYEILELANLKTMTYAEISKKFNVNEWSIWNTVRWARKNPKQCAV